LLKIADIEVDSCGGMWVVDRVGSAAENNERSGAVAG